VSGNRPPVKSPTRSWNDSLALKRLLR
jgi:hypothetical protein